MNENDMIASIKKVTVGQVSISLLVIAMLVAVLS